MPDTRSPHRRRFTSRLSSTLICAALLAAALASPLAAQDDNAFGEVIDVRVVNIEVVVTEQGERVRGLKAEDFVLEVDGEEVPIEYFTEVFGGTAVLPPSDGGDGTVPALAPGEPVSTSYLVFIDNFFSVDRDRNRVIDGLIEQLPNLAVEDRMAIVAYDGKKVDMLTNWSGSVPALTRAFKAAQRTEAQGLQRLAEERAYDTRSTLDRQDLLTGAPLVDPNVQGLDLEEEQYARLISQQVESAIKAASATLRGFANPPGRKVMLLLSGGWPNDPARYVVTDPARAIDVYTQRISYGQQLIGDLVETANLLSYTLYPVDVPGVFNRAVDISDPTLEIAERRREDAAFREQESEFSLLSLANQTGGRAFIDGARDSAFERVVADTRSYYWIGFTPNWQGDDTDHEIEVDVKRRGLDVRSREGYSDLSRQAEVTLMVESALRFGDAPAAVPLAAEVGRGKRSGWGKREVPLSLTIPMDEVTFLPQAKGLLAQLELRVAVLDERGNEAEIPVVPLTFMAREQPKEGAKTVYETSLKLRNQRHDLVVSIYDVASGKILSTKIEVAER
ncbi:MAG: VWA domain-containing protein [Acidobacteriota bacterium]